MNILLCTNSFEIIGGAEKFLFRLANSLSLRGHKVFMYSFLEKELSTNPILMQILDTEYNNVVFYEKYKISWVLDMVLSFFDKLITRPIFKQRLFDLYTNYKENSNVRNFIKINKIHIINTHLWSTDFYFSKVNKRINHVISMHGDYEYYLQIFNEKHSIEINNQLFTYKKFIKTTEQILNKSRKVILAADKNLEIFNHIKYNGIKNKIYYGLENKEKFTNNINSRSFVIGLFARGLETKGWQVLLDSFFKIKEKSSLDLSLLLLYTETDYMKDLKLKYEFDKSIKFLGFKNNPEEFIKKMNLVVFPTYFPGESLPNTIIEALMFNIPVISTNHGDIREMLRVKDNIFAGKIIDKKDSKGIPDYIEFAEAILEYLKKPEIYSEHKKRTQLAFQKFKMDNCIDEYLNIYTV